MTSESTVESLSQKTEAYRILLDTLRAQGSLPEKIDFLKKQSSVKHFLSEHREVLQEVEKLSQLDQFIILSLLIIEQGNLLSSPFEIKQLASSLRPVESFYSFLGGIIGYHMLVLELIDKNQKKELSSITNKVFYKPQGIDLAVKDQQLRHYIRFGIESLPNLCEIYPVAGAGDRLALCDEATKEPLPAAQLLLVGKSLLEGLIRDLQAREYLYYKLFGKVIFTPIALMTSHEKHNHTQILAIFEKNNWFGRPKETFRFFIQPSAPLISQEGEWATKGKMPLLKPGGHGVIWKLAQNEGVFDWLFAQKRYHALIRQINNPVAGVDDGLIAFTGIGLKEKKQFGFASCERLLNTAEGMDVLVEKKVSKGFEYGITNVEYTDFEKHGIQDIAANENSPYSLFPANTNILFADLKIVQEVARAHPLTGMLMNMKTTVWLKGKKVPVGRLESTMQNIADFIVDFQPNKIEPKNLKTFITYNTRRKTISVTKKSYIPNQPIHETPIGAFYDMMHNMSDLFTKHCHFQLPPMPQEEIFLKEGPPFILLYHPALGPLFDVIKQKIQRGKIEYGSELQLEIAELDLQQLELEGSLLIHATSILGKETETGKCILKNVKVKNKGINRLIPQDYWKHQVERKETCQITLHGNAEFYAEDVTLEGQLHLNVPDSHRMSVSQGKNGTPEIKLEKIQTPGWYWRYTFDSTDAITLHRVH